MKEEFLHYVWKYGLFPKNELKTIQGNNIEVINLGTPNANAGPDFINARIKIDDTLWAGNVEIHVKASQWQTHNHHTDTAYDSVILHVVYEADKEIVRSTGETIPCLQLPIPADLMENYKTLTENSLQIKCASILSNLDNITISSWLNRMFIERLEQKTNHVKRILEATTNNWDETYYRVLARNFGFSVNADAMEQLSRSVPYNLIIRYSLDQSRLEALLLGQSGLLMPNDCLDQYTLKLKSEYQYLKHKHSLNPLDFNLWKQFRTRTTNFPTLRIAQLATILHSLPDGFSSLVHDYNSFIKKLEKITFSPYWEKHYSFGKEKKYTSSTFSFETINLILINTIIPILFHYGEVKGLEKLQEDAVSISEDSPPEVNTYTKLWKTYGIIAQNALQSQALVHLKKEYCEKGRCIHCKFGHTLLHCTQK
ncbi:MAG: DUF2851 family protein [Bacteroidales bacterium]